MRERPERRCKQARRFRGKIMPVGIGTAHDGREMLQGFDLKCKFLDHHVEGTQIAPVTPENTFDIKRRCLEFLRNRHDLGRCHETGTARFDR